MGVLLLCGSQFGCLGGGLVGFTPTKAVRTVETCNVLEESRLDWRGSGIYFSGNVLLRSSVSPPHTFSRRYWSFVYLLLMDIDDRIVADDSASFVRPFPIVLTVLAIILFPAFLLWERRQERLQKTCIMPLYVWKNKSFTAVCIAVFLAWAAFNGVQYFATLTSPPPPRALCFSNEYYFSHSLVLTFRFQEVQNKSTTTTSLYFIPCVIAGAATNIAAGLLVSRVKANHLAFAGALATTIAPVLLANMNLEWSYWRAVFWAMCLTPLSADGISPFLISPDTFLSLVC